MEQRKEISLNSSILKMLQKVLRISQEKPLDLTPKTRYTVSIGS